MSKRATIAASLALALALAGGIARAEGETAATVIATVNGTAITLGEMAALREGLPDQYKNLPDDVLFRGILDQLIQQTALSQQVEGKLGQRDAAGLEITRRAFLAGVALRSAVDGVVTDAAIQAAYDKKFADFKGETEYNASHILVETEEAAQAIIDELAGGADFAELARTRSTGPSGPNGGSLGWFGKGMMVKEFEDAVFAMKPGEVVGPIQTQFGWHLIKLNETRIASAPPLDEVRDDLVAEIETAAVQSRIDGAVDGADVQRNDEGIDPALLRDQTIFKE